LGNNEEQIVNGLIRSLKKKNPDGTEMAEFDIEKQGIIFDFLYGRCKDYERNHFINVVAGMEILEGKPGEEERKWHPTSGNIIFEKIKKPISGVDRRREFLDAFGTTLISYNDPNRAYNECIGGRLIISDPMHQKVLRGFSESTEWLKRIVLAPFGAVSVEDLIQKAKQKLSENSADLNQTAQSFEDRARAFYEKSKRGR
jgi:hypothetical protein